MKGPAAHLSIRSLQLLLGWILASCLTPISLELDNGSLGIVVTGQVSTIADRTFVTVATATGPERLPLGIANATVTLHDDSGNIFPFTEIPNQNDPGNYKLTGFAATPGVTYHVRVAVGGNVFESRPEQVPLQTGTDVLTYDFGEETLIDADGIPFTNQLINVYTTPTLPPNTANDPTYIKWTLDEVYMIIPTDFPDPFGHIPPSCYVSQAVEPQRIVLYDGSRFTQPTTGRIKLAQRVAFQSFHYRHYFISYQGAITKDAHEYWTRVQTLTQQVGSIFDTPPSPITGNVVNVENPAEPVMGYFQAVNESLERIFLTRFDLPFQLPDYCDYTGDRPYSFWKPECLQCISVRNASFVRPPWFGE